MSGARPLSPSKNGSHTGRNVVQESRVASPPRAVRNLADSLSHSPILNCTPIPSEENFLLQIRKVHVRSVHGYRLTDRHASDRRVSEARFARRRQRALVYRSSRVIKRKLKSLERSGVCQSGYYFAINLIAYS